MASNQENDEIGLKDFIQMMYENLETNMNQKFAELSAKMDGNTLNMNQRFAEVDERFAKAETAMETTSQRINLVEKSVNDTLTSIMDDVSADIKTQIGEARSEFQDVITATNDRVRIFTERINEQFTEMKSNNNITRLENDRQMADMSKSLATVATRVETIIGVDFPRGVKAVMKPMIDNVFQECDLLKASMANVEASVEAIETKHFVTTEHLQLYYNALEKDIFDVKTKQAVTNTEIERMGSSMANNVAEVSARVDKLERPVRSGSIHSINPDDWIVDPTTLTMGEETIAFMRENDSPASKGQNKGKKKISKSKKKHLESEDEDPSGSDPSSSSSSSSESDESSSSDSSSEKSRRKSKKKGKAKALLDPEKFGAGGRRTSIIGDEGMREPVGGGYYRDRGSAYLCIQPPPDTKDLYLDKIRIDSVLAFCKKFNSESARHVGGLKVGNYISDHARSQLRQVAIKHKLPGQEGIIRSGVQTISNEEVFALLSTIVAPKNLEAMQYELYQSCFPKSTFDYSDAQSTVNNITEFKNDILIYIDRFEDKLRLLGYTRKAKKFLPKRLFKKGGSAANPGLADYFIYGLPRPEFGWNIWGSVDDEKKEKCVQWETFLKLYMKAIERIEKRERQKKINRSIAIGVKEMVKTDRMQRITMRQAKDSRKPQRVHAISRDNIETVISEGSDDDKLPFSDEDGDMLSAIPRRGEDSDEDEEHHEEDEYKSEEQELRQLAREALVCYDMANTGKCSRTNCQYSHKPEDIERFKQAKARKLEQAKKQPHKQVSFSKPTVAAPRRG